jgi:hypothetical protein
MCTTTLPGTVYVWAIVARLICPASLSDTGSPSTLGVTTAHHRVVRLWLLLVLQLLATAAVSGHVERDSPTATTRSRCTALTPPAKSIRYIVRRWVWNGTLPITSWPCGHRPRPSHKCTCAVPFLLNLLGWIWKAHFILISGSLNLHNKF